MVGRVVKIISNQFEVLYENEAIKCVAMGKIRLQKQIVVGDFVEFEKFDSQYGIQKILPRTNEMIRPMIANVDQAMIIMSAVEPDFSCQLIDRLCILVNHANIKPIIVVTKLDMCDKDLVRVTRYIDDYRKSGYKIICASKGVRNLELIELFKDKITVLTGQSGAGKSTLINTYNTDFEIHTQPISKALGRGKHTTRHTQLFKVCDGFVADTPGFSSLDFEFMNVTEVEAAVSDFNGYRDNCKFRDCKHHNEPNCAIKAGVEDKTISKIRYINYLDVLKIVMNKKEKY